MHPRRRMTIQPLAVVVTAIVLRSSPATAFVRAPAVRPASPCVGDALGVDAPLPAMRIPCDQGTSYRPREDDRCPIDRSHRPWRGVVNVCASLATFGAALGPFCPDTAGAAALTENQRLVSDVWFAVTAQYFDPSFNGLGESGWRAKEKEAIAAVADAGPDDGPMVEGAIKAMLGALDDPYTRFLNGDKYETMTTYATGKGRAGIGVQLLEDPRTRDVMVMAVRAGGPAANAGVRAGDLIVKVGGENVEGMTADAVAVKCRGDVGEKVDVEILRRDDGESTQRVTLVRAQVDPNPIEASTYTSDGGKRIGLLKVPSFSTETVAQVVKGLQSVSSEADGKIDAIAIDIRGNVGGYMPAGVDAAKLFLPARAHIIAEVGKPGAPMKTYDADGIGADTSMPLYLLVDERTASAAEIFAAALQDNRRAVIVGDTNTFGKGRIQNVQSLGGGGGVAVTRARYITPRGRDLHGVGIAPDRTPGRCGASVAAQVCLADVVDAS